MAFSKEYATKQLLRANHHLRRLIKYLYLNNILREATGSTIDFGCGAGQLLTYIPNNSIDLETNP